MMNVQGPLALGTIPCQKNLKPVLAERRRKHSPQRQIVVDDQDAFAIDIRDALHASGTLRPDFVHDQRHSIETPSRPTCITLAKESLFILSRGDGEGSHFRPFAALRVTSLINRCPSRPACN